MYCRRHPGPPERVATNIALRPESSSPLSASAPALYDMVAMDQIRPDDVVLAPADNGLELFGHFEPEPRRVTCFCRLLLHHIQKTSRTPSNRILRRSVRRCAVISARSIAFCSQNGDFSRLVLRPLTVCRSRCFFSIRLIVLAAGLFGHRRMAAAWSNPHVAKVVSLLVLMA